MKNLSTPFVSGFGGYVPPRIVTNFDLEKFVDTSDEWIVSRTGIKERRFCDKHTTNAELGVKSALVALEKSGFSPDEITHILYGTCTPDASFPSTACLLQSHLGITNTLSLDINAACTSFVYGLELAKAITIADEHAVVLLVATDTLSKRINWEDRNTCVLFGDGSGSVIVSGAKATPKNTIHLIASIVDIQCSSNGSLGDLLFANGGGSSHPYKLGDIVGKEYFLQMQGREVFKQAVRCMSSMCTYILEKNNLLATDIDVVIPHQANIRIIEAVCSRLGVPLEKVFINVDRIGNTSAASIPFALHEAVEQNFIKQGNKVLLVTFGAGFTWASTILQF